MDKYLLFKASKKSNTIKKFIARFVGIQIHCCIKFAGVGHFDTTNKIAVICPAWIYGE
jgi:hypothetical protein